MPDLKAQKMKQKEKKTVNCFSISSCQTWWFLLKDYLLCFGDTFSKVFYEKKVQNLNWKQMKAKQIWI